MAAKSRKKLVTLILLILLAGCANQLPPGGGEVDKIPPEVVDVYPPDETINFDDDYIEIEFSEYVDKRSFQEALFISPFIEGGLDFSWTSSTVTIEFKEKLKKDITYTVNVGSDVVDLNNKNRMANSYSFTFSTG
ncbi:MAG: Ig-like domain-containing protein, partial [Ignavibacteriaceae bacterium]